MSTLSDRIQSVVTFTGLSKTGFGKEINLSQSMVSKLCSGAAAPSDRTISDICRVFDVNEVWLLTGEGEMIDYATREAEFRACFSQILPNNEEPVGELCKALAQLPDSTVCELLRRWEDDLKNIIEEYMAKKEAPDATNIQD